MHIAELSDRYIFTLNKKYYLLLVNSFCVCVCFHKAYSGKKRNIQVNANALSGQCVGLVLIPMLTWIKRRLPTLNAHTHSRP